MRKSVATLLTVGAVVLSATAAFADSYVVQNTTINNLVSADQPIKASSDPVKVFGIDIRSDVGTDSVTAVDINFLNVVGFDLATDIESLTTDETSGVSFWADNGTVNGDYDENDTLVPVSSISLTGVTVTINFDESALNIIPTSNSAPYNSNDFYVIVRTSADIDENDEFYLQIPDQGLTINHGDEWVPTGANDSNHLIADTTPPSDPVGGNFTLTQNIAGTNDLLVATAGAVEGDAWVRVFNDDSRSTQVAYTSANADGSVTQFSLGDGATVDDVVLNNQTTNSVFVYVQDIAGNYSLSSYEMTNDVLGPVASVTSTIDADGDGKVDGVEVTFDENIDDSSVDGDVLDGMTIAGQACDTFSSTVGADTDVDDEYATFSISVDSNEIDGTDLKAVNYATPNGSGHLTDALGNEMLSGAGIGTTHEDGAEPILMSAQTTSHNDVELTFSELVTGYGSTSISVAGVTFASTSPSGTAASTISWLTAAGGTTWNTNATGSGAGEGTDENGTHQTTVPTVTIADDAFTDNSTEANGVTGVTGWTGMTDGAAPVLIDDNGTSYAHTISDKQVQILFSEDMGALGGTQSFRIPNEASGAGTSPTGISYSASGAGSSFTLAVSQTNAWNTDATGAGPGDGTDSQGTAKTNAKPEVTIVASHGLEDEAGNGFNAAGEVYAGARDEADPVAWMMEYRDADGAADGQVDQVAVVYSESITGAQASDWSVANLGGASVSSVAITDYSGLTDTDNELLITLDGGATANTTYYASATVSYTSSGGTDIADVSAQGNEASVLTLESLADAAAPLLHTGQPPEYKDVDVTVNPGRVDRLYLYFTEDMSSSNVTYEASDWTLTANDLNGFDAIAGLNSVNSNYIRFSAYGNANITGVNGGTEPTVAYTNSGTANSITDAAGNALASFSATTVTDGAIPYAYSYEYVDSEMNGTVDRVDLTFSEYITFSYNSLDWTLSNNDVLSLAITADNVTDNVLSFDVNADADETGVNGGNVPQLNYNNQANRLNDGNGNNVPDTDWDLVDAAAPYLLTARYYDSEPDGQVDNYKLTFTEYVSIDYSGSDWSVTTPGDITLQEETGITGNNTATLTVSALGDANETGVNGGTEPVIAFNHASHLTDLVGNALTSISTTLTDMAAPYAYYGRYEDSDFDGQVDKWTVWFTENVSTSSYSDGDWSVDTAGDINLQDDTGGTVFATNIAFVALGDADVTGVNGGTEPVIAYTNVGDRLTDANSNYTDDFTLELNDAALPQALTYRYYDSEPDGQVDQFQVTFTENVIVTYDDADWTVGAGDLGLANETAVSGSGSSTLQFSALGTADVTGVNGGTEPTVAYTNNSNNVYDADSNVLATFAAQDLVDYAAPYCMTYTYLDATSVDGMVDQVFMEFTEEVTYSYADADWGVTTAGVINLQNESNGTLAGDDLSVTFTVTADANITGANGGQEPVFDYTNNGDNLTDANGNATTSYSRVLVDDASPYPYRFRYYDTNVNGQVNEARITFSENLNAAQFDYNDADWTITAGDLNLANESDVSVSGSIATITALGAVQTTGVDGGAEPTVEYSHASHLQDANGNALTAIAATSLVDYAAPYPFDFGYEDHDLNGTIDRVVIDFTENTNFTWDDSNWNVLANNLTNFAIAGVNSGDGTHEIILDASALANRTGANGGTEPTMEFQVAGDIDDDNSNQTQALSARTVSDDAKPQVMGTDGIVYLDANNDGNVDLVNVTFTEFVSTSWDNGDWVITSTDLTAQETGLSIVGSVLSLNGSSWDAQNTAPASPTLAFTGLTNDVEDLAVPPNTLATFGATAIEDRAAPVANLFEYYDSDTDGTIDQVKIQFTENTTFTWDSGSWTITPNGLEGLDVTAVESGNGTTLITLTATADAQQTGVDGGNKPTMEYTTPTDIADATGNLTVAFDPEELFDKAAPQLAATDPIVYTDVNSDGQVDQVVLTYTEFIDYNTFSSGDWTFDASALEVTYPTMTGRIVNDNQLTLVGFTAVANKTYLNNPLLTYTGSNVSDEADTPNDAATFADHTIIDRAKPVVASVTVGIDPIRLGETQTMSITFTEELVVDGTEDPNVSYTTANGTIVDCATNSDWQETGTGLFVKSVRYTEGDATIQFGESGTATISISLATDENDNQMNSTTEFTFVIDASASRLTVDLLAVGDQEAGVPFVVRIVARAQAPDTTIDTEFTGPVAFSANLDNVTVPAENQLLANGEGLFYVTAYDTTGNLPAPYDSLRVSAFYGSDLSVNGTSEGIKVGPAVIDAPNTAYSYDNPDDQGNYITVISDLSNNDPFAAGYTGYNPIDEYHIYRDLGAGTLVLVAIQPVTAHVDSMRVYVNTHGDTMTYDYYVAAIGNDASGFNGINHDRRNKGVKEASGQQTFYQLGHPDAQIGDLFIVDLDRSVMNRLSTDRVRSDVARLRDNGGENGHFASQLTSAGSARAYDNIPPMAVPDFAVSIVANTDVELSWGSVDQGINGSYELYPLNYHVYRGTNINEIEDLIAVTPTPEFVDAGAAGDPSVNYFYRVAARDLDNESERTEILAEWDVTFWNNMDNTDWTFAALPVLDPAITDAEALGLLSGDMDAAADWDPSSQSYVQHVLGTPFNNFAVDGGYGYFLNNPVAQGVISQAGSPVTDVNFNLVTTTNTNWNDIVVPLDRTDITTAEELAVDIPAADGVAWFDPEAQQWIQHVTGTPFNNFAVREGYAYLTNVTEAGSWPDVLLARTESGEIVLEDQPTDAPHLIWGEVRTDAGEIPGEDMQITAYVLGRNYSLITMSDGITVQDGYWSVQMADFAEPWMAGETLRIELRDENGNGANLDVELTWSSSDQGGLVTLAPLPTSYALYQNYPNPFNPTTTIAYDIVDRTRVQIAIYNILGEQVATVVNEVLPAGSYTVMWNGRNDRGLEMASGTYFMRMHTNEFTQTRKLMKVK